MKEWKWHQKISKEIFTSKYMLQNEKDIDSVFRLIAEEVALAEKKENRKKTEEEFYNELSSTRLIPAGRILANSRPQSPMKNYNNCFTIDVEDSMEGIFNSLKEDALISKMGGGVGFDISKLRPKGESLSKGGESSGVISFLKIFDQSAKTIITGGQRRSAHIALLDISHPDIEEFISIKKGDKNKVLTQFNISVKVSDAFIEAVKVDKDWELVFDGKVYKTLKARDLYDKLAHNAYKHNEPGIFNRDIVERYNNGYWAFKMDRVNPCGELVMPSYSLCCLSALNLTQFVDNPFSDTAAFDVEKFRKTVSIAIRFLDNVLERTDYPLDKIKEFSKKWRRIGLGITGLGDLFAMLKVSYGSEESLKISEIIASNLRDESYISSSLLAAEKGSFPSFERDKLLNANFVKQLPDKIRKSIKENGLRNIQMNTIAPTGTTSFSVGQNCSSGIEPIFSVQYERNIRTGRGNDTKTETVYDYAWLMYLEEFGNEAEKPDYFSTTLDIDPYRAIDVQAVFQKYIDHSISKTLNLPPGTSYEEYKNMFMYAYEKGLKGFTTFNPEGSMKGVLEYKSNKSENPNKIVRSFAPERPQSLPCDIHRVVVDGVQYIVLAGILNGSVYELFVLDDPEDTLDLVKFKTGIVKKPSKGRYDLILEKPPISVYLKDFTKVFHSTDSSLARFISMALRHGTPLQFIVDQLNKDKNFYGFERSVSRVLKRYIKDGEEVLGSKTCPECNEKLIYRDGCITCAHCGWSKCS